MIDLSVSMLAVLMGLKNDSCWVPGSFRVGLEMLKAVEALTR